MTKANIGLQVHNTDGASIRPVEAPVVSTNQTLNKPTFAFWTSTFTGRHGRIVHSAWNDWAFHNGMLKRHNFLLVPKNRLQVLEIASYEDYANVRKDEAGCIDFGWYAENGYDGVHVTDRAVSESRFIQSYGNTYSLGLSLWDVESFCWFHTRWVASTQHLI